jgi:molybdenum cofactor synthesis domain-containing protein
MFTVGLLVIGNEILSGKVVDTNSPYLAKELRSLGVELQRILTIPDDIDLIARETRVMSDTFDYVFTSGGIGPTHDDLTMGAVAKAFDRKLVLNQSMYDRIARNQPEPLNESQRKMAMLPEGAKAVDAGDLWFPIVIVENVHVFPGIPQLFEKKFEAIRDRFRGDPFHLKQVFVTRHESDIAQSLNDLLGEFPNVMVGSYPRLGETHYRVLLTLESRDLAYLERALASLLERIPDEAVHRVE